MAGQCNDLMNWSNLHIISSNFVIRKAFYTYFLVKRCDSSSAVRIVLFFRQVINSQQCIHYYIIYFFNFKIFVDIIKVTVIFHPKLSIFIVDSEVLSVTNLMRLGLRQFVMLEAVWSQ